MTRSSPRFLPQLQNVLALLTFGMLVTACGGGSGGSSGGNSGDSGGTPPPPQITLTSTVVKGVLQKADVTVYSVIAGEKGKALGSAQTDVTGRFTIELPATQPGPYYIEAVTSSASKMICDVTGGCGTRSAASSDDKNADGLVDFGEWYPAPTLTLSAFAANAGALNAMSITPLTHLATRAALSDPAGLTQVTAAAAYSQTSQLLGSSVAVASTEAIDITSAESLNAASPAEKQYSLMNAAFLKLGGNNIGVALETYTDTFIANSGNFLKKSANGTELTQETLWTASSTLAIALNDTEAQQLFSGLLDTIKDASPGDPGDFTPAPEALAETLTAIETLRTQWMLWRAELPFPSATTKPFVTANGDVMRSDLAAHWTMLRALGDLGEFAPEWSVPTLKSTSICNLLTGTNQFICNAYFLLQKKPTLQEECPTPASPPKRIQFSINDESICAYFEHFPQLSRPGLKAVVNVYTGTSTLKGTLDGYTVDLTATPKAVPKESASTKIATSVAGSLQSTAKRWTLSNASMDFTYTATISATTIFTPDHVKGSAAITRTDVATSGTADNAVFATTLDMSMSDYSKLQSSSTQEELLSSVALTFNSIGLTTVPAAGSAHIKFTGSKTPGTAFIDIQEPLPASQSQPVAQLRMLGVPARWTTGLVDVQLLWDTSKRLNAAYSKTSLSVSDQASTRADLPEDAPDTGSIYVKGEKAASLKLKNDVWTIALPNKTEVDL